MFSVYKEKRIWMLVRVSFVLLLFIGEWNVMLKSLKRKEVVNLVYIY